MEITLEPKRPRRRRDLGLWRGVPYPELLPQLREHVEALLGQGADGWVFVDPKRARLRRSGFRRTWNKTRTAVDLPDLHFHDLRHVGNTPAAANGAGLKELMARMVTRPLGRP
ncbi:tyrosine-type recombinase/integrase [Microbispora sp. NEAU-D428]|uniref:tyrosine-type recombinase/integrase n=1 Tax=Microbispora sitophila TaxID=2771537 RepID=UPI0018661143|nr:tyrosine-type recombinase/integrase [Microbispora sitophila]MBE3014907.1 tyrosine-type recombinase/integrase [Microbispora sitophila]